LAQTHLPPFWDSHLCAVLGIPKTHEAFRFLSAQQRAEGGTAKWNPLNSKLYVDQFTLSPDYNAQGVRNYAYPAAGVCATALTFISRNEDGTLKYGRLLGLLQAGKSTAEQIVDSCQDEISGWGTDPVLMMELLKEIP